MESICRALIGVVALVRRVHRPRWLDGLVTLSLSLLVARNSLAASDLVGSKNSVYRNYLPEAKSVDCKVARSVLAASRRVGSIRLQGDESDLIREGSNVQVQMMPQLNVLWRQVPFHFSGEQELEASLELPLRAPGQQHEALRALIEKSQSQVSLRRSKAQALEARLRLLYKSVKLRREATQEREAYSEYGKLLQSLRGIKGSGIDGASLERRVELEMVILEQQEQARASEQQALLARLEALAAIKKRELERVFLVPTRSASTSDWSHSWPASKVVRPRFSKLKEQLSGIQLQVGLVAVWGPRPMDVGALAGISYTPWSPAQLRSQQRAFRLLAGRLDVINASQRATMKSLEEEHRRFHDARRALKHFEARGEKLLLKLAGTDSFSGKVATVEYLRAKAELVQTLLRYRRGQLDLQYNLRMREIEYRSILAVSVGLKKIYCDSNARIAKRAYSKYLLPLRVAGDRLTIGGYFRIETKRMRGECASE